ncbi:MAG: hypothetical protein IMF09_03925 [Proteobacteria bacterium]|nr:hypothetical protein [Pseudomonadota bacterium]
MGYKIHLSIIFLALLLWLNPAPAADLFDSTSTMEITLAAPWGRLVRNIERDDRYPAKLTYTTRSGNQLTLDVEVKPSGNTRRYITCNFPPLKVYFDTEQSKNTEFSKYEFLRLTTYCKKKSKYEQYAIREFTAYRIYNEITDLSVRVRPLIINYKNSNSNSKSSTRLFSYFSEDSGDVALRNHLQLLPVNSVDPLDFQSLEMANFALFQYLIGNVDWSVVGCSTGREICCHNSSIAGINDNTGPKYAIPYDFDSTGLVNADYAAAPDKFQLKSIRHRLYRGFCSFNDKLPEAVSRFNQVRPQIMAIFDSTSKISKNSRKYTHSYIEDFYAIINDPKQFQSEIISACRE